MTPEELRQSIPALQDAAYMNFGASGPSPRQVVDSTCDYLHRQEFEAPGAEGMYTVAFDAYDEARETIADFVGAEPGSIALTESTSDGINRFACALPWEPGDVVVRTDLEHPAGILPWLRLERVRDIEIRIVESNHGRLDIEAYKEAVTGAKLVVFSALTWTHGTRIPVQTLVEIAHDAGALVLVDAVQWIGQTQMDVSEWGADAVAASGHKWLLGPWGAGILYVADHVASDLEPGTIGYRGVEESSETQYELAAGASRFEIGTSNAAPHVGLQTAISLFEEIGIDVVEQRIRELSQRLAEQIPEDRLLSPSSPESGLVTIDVEDPEEVTERLQQENIVIRPLPGPDAVRASIHAVNTTSEVDDLAQRLSDHL